MRRTIVCIVGSLWLIASTSIAFGQTLSDVLEEMKRDIRENPGAEYRCHHCFACGPKEMPVPEWPAGLDIHDDVEKVVCDNRLRIDAEGRTEVLSVNCSDSAFNDVTKHALNELEWRKFGGWGRRCPEPGSEIDYPFEYEISN